MSGEFGAKIGSQENQPDEQRRKVAGWVAGVRGVQDGEFVGFSVETTDLEPIGDIITADNADIVMARLLARYGETYPDLFPDGTGLEVGHDRRVSDVYAFPEQHAQASHGVLEADRSDPVA